MPSWQFWTSYRHFKFNVLCYCFNHLPQIFVSSVSSWLLFLPTGWASQNLSVLLDASLCPYHAPSSTLNSLPSSLLDSVSKITSILDTSHYLTLSYLRWCHHFHFDFLKLPSGSFPTTSTIISSSKLLTIEQFNDLYRV